MKIALPTCGLVHSGVVIEPIRKLTAKTKPVELPTDLEEALRQARPRADADVVFLIPPHSRDGVSLYSPDDVDGARLAKEAGLNARFLDPSADRRYLHEYHAGWVGDVALAVGEGLGATGIAAISKYLLLRARAAVKRNLDQGPEDNVQIRLTLVTMTKDRKSATSLRAFRIEGPAKAVADTARYLLENEQTPHPQDPE